MKKKKKGWYVMYVEDATPFLRKFKSEKAVKEFVKGFKKLGSQEQGFWIDLIFKGELHWSDETINMEYE